MKLIISILCLLILSCSDRQTDTSSASIQNGIEFPVAELEDSGINSDSIQSLLTLIKETPPRDFRGLVVIKNDQIIIEEYFNTYMRNTIHDIRSAGKSVTSLLLGIALKDGLIKNLDQDVYSFFPKKKYPFISEETFVEGVI